MWLGVIQWVESVFCVDSFTYSSYTMTWTNGSSVAAGFATIDLDSGALTQNFWAGETFGPVFLPLGYVIRQPGLQNFLVADYSFADGAPNRMTRVGEFLFSLHVSIVSGTCAASADGFGEAEISQAGMAHNVGYVIGCRYTRPDDFAIVLMVSVNKRYAVGPFPISLPYQQVYGGVQVVQSSTAPITINNAPPLDVDVAINSGQAIYSVNSKTTTMLP
jgi:hypothetical protein